MPSKRKSRDAATVEEEVADEEPVEEPVEEADSEEIKTSGITMHV